MSKPHDPYASPPPPTERSGPLLRFAIVAVLLGAAVWGYMAFYQDGPGLVEAGQEQAELADSDSAHPAKTGAVPPLETSQAQPAPAAGSPSATAVPPG